MARRPLCRVCPLTGAVLKHLKKVRQRFHCRGARQSQRALQQVRLGLKRRKAVVRLAAALTERSRLERPYHRPNPHPDPLPLTALFLGGLALHGATTLAHGLCEMRLRRNYRHGGCFSKMDGLRRNCPCRIHNRNHTRYRTLQALVRLLLQRRRIRRWNCPRPTRCRSRGCACSIWAICVWTALTARARLARLPRRVAMRIFSTPRRRHRLPSLPQHLHLPHRTKLESQSHTAPTNPYRSSCRHVFVIGTQEVASRLVGMWQPHNLG
jgi:hypothetical protein